MLHALALSRRVESSELAPLDLVEICAKAIAQSEPAVGAFAALDIEAARRRAGAQSEKLRASPLRGMPVGFKDIFDSADFPTEYGSSIYANYHPPADAALVAMALRAGANILGKTVTTELAHLKPSRTRNPRNLAYSPGGSSSGSAAAVAAGMLPVAFGSQTGGSVVRPAAYCGVAGFKPSYKLLPMAGAKCFSWHLDTAGLFAASVPDVAFAAAAVSGRDLRVDAPPKDGPRIGLVRTHIWTQASPAMRNAVETAAKRAQASGALVTEITLPAILDDAWHAHPTIQDYEAVRALAFEYDRHRDKIGPLLRQLLDDGLAITADAYDEARRTTRRARQALAEVMADVDVLLTPSAPGVAPDPSSTGQAIFNRLWTLMGTPCVNVPGLADENGLPLGVQVVGRFGRDRRALEVAAFIEAAVAG